MVSNIIFPKQLSDLVGAQQGTQPIPFILMTNEEAHVGIGSLVTRSSVNYVAQRGADGGAKYVQIKRILCLICGLVVNERGSIMWRAYRYLLAIERGMANMAHAILRKD